MANEPISGLTDGSPLLAADELPINRGGTNYSIKGNQIRGGGPNTIVAMDYGVKADTKVVFDASWSSGSNPTTVTCPNNDCNFTSADTGKSCFGVLGGAYLASSLGTFTYVGAQTGTCSGGVGQSTASSDGVFVWGTNDTTALLAATTALYALPHCGTLVLPGGRMLLSQGIGASIPTACTQGGNFAGALEGITVVGQGRNTTFLMPTPGFNFATCTSIGCFWNGSGGNDSAGLNFRDFSIDGASAALTGVSTSPATTSLFSISVNGTLENVYLIGWASGSSTQAAAFYTNGQGNWVVGMQIGQFGSGVFKCGNGGVTLIANYSGTKLVIDSNSFCYDINGYWGGSALATANYVEVPSGSTLFAKGTVIMGNNAGSVGFNVANNGKLYMEDVAYIGSPYSATFIGVKMGGSGSVVHARDSEIGGGSSGGAVSGSAGTFYDHGGNIFTGLLSTYTGAVYGAGGSGIGCTYAALGTPTDGTITYCSDCTVANPCTGSGTGAIAKRLNGAWVCN